jgi:hypothetical protein
MRDKTALMEKLKEEKEKYLPYLEDHAPICQSLKEKIELKNFILDGKEEVSLPHSFV